MLQKNVLTLAQCEVRQLGAKGFMRQQHTLPRTTWPTWTHITSLQFAWADSLLILFFFSGFTYLFESSHREGRGQSDIVKCANLPLKWPVEGWAKVQPRARNLIQVLQGAGRSPGIFCCSPRCTCRKLGHMWSSQYSSWCAAGMWVTQVVSHPAVPQLFPCSSILKFCAQD